MEAKRLAAVAALGEVRDGMVVGLGTGSTADHFLIALGEALATGKLADIRGVPTSTQSERRATELGIPLTTLAECPAPDVTVDGTDEVSRDLDLIKGLGGALLREKIVAQNSRRLVIVADGSKCVDRLGTHGPLPVEVAPFAHETHESFFRKLGCAPTLRRDGGAVFVTDNGNYIYDCHFAGGIDDPAALDRALRARAGIVETGLFLRLADLALIGDETGVRTIERE